MLIFFGVKNKVLSIVKSSSVLLCHFNNKTSSREKRSKIIS